MKINKQICVCAVLIAIISGIWLPSFSAGAAETGEYITAPLSAANETTVENAGVYSGEILNGSFETGTLNGWNDPGSGICEVISGGAAETEYALKFNTSASQWRGPTQLITLKPDTVYDFSLWAKIPDDSERDDQWHVIALKDTNGKDKFNISLHIRSKEWQLFKTEIITDSETNILTVAPMIANIYKNSSFLIDEITLTERAMSFDGYIRNGDFEINNADFWTFSDSAIGTVISENGNRAINLTGDNGAEVYQDIIVEKNSNYKFFVDAKAAEDGATGAISAFVKDESGNILENIPLNGLKAGEYSSFSFGINSADKTALRVGVCVDGSCNVILDNLKLSNYKPVPLTLSAFRCKYNTVADESRNMLENPGFETGGGIWNNSVFLEQEVLSVTSSDAHSGKNSLYFNSSEKNDTVKRVFWLEITPNTEYVFSAWVKGPYLSESNIGKATFGIVDPETYGYLVDPAQPAVASNSERQMCTSAYDNEWHLVAVSFNSGEKKKVGIAVSGYGSQLYIDDMVFCKAADAAVYVPDGVKSTVNIENTAVLTRCKRADNLLENYDFSNLESTYWANAQGYKNAFLKIKENGYEYGNSLEYSQSEIHSGLFYIKWIDIKPNTSYTFSGNYKTVLAGNGFLCLIDGKKVTSDYIKKVFFNESGGWDSFAVTFNSGKITRVGVAVCDLGGKALIDNLRLFETSKGASVTDRFITTEYERANEVQNGDFEAGELDGWSSWGASDSQLVENGRNDSSYALKLSGGVQWNGIYSEISLKPDTGYHISVWVKTADESDANKDIAQLLKVEQGKAKLLEKNIYANSCRGWQNYYWDIKIGDSTEKIKFLFAIANTGANNSILIDDFSVVEIRQSDDIVFNGDFEYGVAGWQRTHDSNQCDHVENGHNGSGGAMKLVSAYDDGGRGIRQAVTLKPNTKYTVSAYMRLDTESDSKNVAFKFKISSITESNGNGYLNTDVWTYKSFEFETGNTVCEGYIEILNEWHQQPGILLIDDVKIVAAEYTTEIINNKTYIKNTSLTGELEVPEYICGQKVYGISAGAFTGGNITKLEIPYGITLADGAVSDGTVISANPYSDAVRYAKENNITYIYNCGDVNGNGTTDILDLVRLKRHLADSTTEIDRVQADIDPRGEKGAIDAADLAALKKILLESSRF